MFDEFDEGYDEYSESFDFEDAEFPDTDSEASESEIAELDAYLADDTSGDSGDIDFSFDEITETPSESAETELAEMLEDPELETATDITIPEEPEQPAIDELLELPEDEQDNPPKVLTRDRDELMSIGMNTIESILDVKADDYRDKGYEAEEISKMLEQDRNELEKEFMKDISKIRK